jgi:osmotically-inducible protein OsmY
MTSHLTLRTVALAISIVATTSFGVVETGCANMEAGNVGTARSAGAASDDENISSLVRTALAADTEYKFDGVNVQTFNSIVQLSGFVTSEDQKTRAGDRASKVSGVKSVENNITIKS